MKSSLSVCLLACCAVAAASPLTAEKRQLDSGTYVTDISQCPSVAPRTTPPTSVHDLRPDDFSVAMAVGDSITAGAFSEGINRQNLLLNFVEFRGLSYAGGGDAGAITVPNLLKHYNKTLVGGSKGVNLGIELCFGPLCPVGSAGWNQPVDQLNAAQSGALASNLLHEVRDYLVPQVKAAGITANQFKYLSFQIGSNDLCQLCLAADALFGPGTQSDFEANIRETLEYVRKNIPNTLVNLFGVFQVSQIYGLTLNEPYCQQFIPNVTHYNLECTAVIWQPPAVPLDKYPIESLSSLDCFHPSTATHQRIAAGLWNRLTLDETARAASFDWETTPKFRCLQADDRIKT
ncbi:unnamed protein product [Rhizoctonia solani]|uniref:Uncharacterized protein n=1 Tax=Rhizoctonia solani TaxID=456999 RepID=A0A8H2WAC1_9AGAM|nr:unnamed protein product [Rhizoctonia solani]